MSDQRRSQRDLVRASLHMADRPEDRHHSYPRRTPRQAALQDQWTIPALAQSIRELGEMLQVAERYPVYTERMAELERLAELVGQRVLKLEAVIYQEFAGLLGVPPVGQGERPC